VALTSPTEGQVVRGTLNLAASASDASGIDQVLFGVDGALVGTSETAPYQASWSSLGAFEGQHSVVAVAYDNHGLPSVQAVNIQIDNFGPEADAVFDAALLAPACRGAVSTCDSLGALAGRGTVGPEQNAPNTLQSSCADGAGGTYGVDESIERLRVRSLDGNALQSGGQAVVDVIVSPYAPAFNADALFLFAADDATAPVWKSLGTLAPVSGDAQVLSLQFTLGTGALQAVRAVFAFNAAQTAACIPGDYNDHDDLAFKVDDSRAPVAGDLVITEIMYNPSGTEPYGEWLEVLNRGTRPVRLGDVDLTSSVETRRLSGVVAAGARVVLCRDAARGPAGCLAYGALFLRNTTEVVSLELGTTVLDSVSYTAGAPWPTSTDGFSIELSELHKDQASNDIGRHWCLATTQGSGLRGTPGTANTCVDMHTPSAGDVVISEIHANPSGIEPDAEWVEIANVTGDVLSLAGLTVTSGTAVSPVTGVTTIARHSASCSAARWRSVRPAACPTARCA
jgi:hypothetical protein